MEQKVSPNEYPRLFEIAKLIVFSFKTTVGTFPTSLIGLLGKSTKIVEFIRVNKPLFEEVIQIVKD